MRRILAATTAILLALAVPAGARSQSADLGLRFGWSRSGLGGPVAERAALNGLSAAASLTVHLTPAFAVQPELLVVRKGAVKTSQLMSVILGDTLRETTSEPLGLLYVEVPVLVRFTPPTAPGGIRPYLAAGPYVAHLLHCASYLESLVTPMASVTAVTPMAAAVAANDTVSVGVACLAGEVHRDDVGAAVAAGFRWPLGSRLSAVLDARYELGWRSVVTTRDVHNRTLGVTAGLSLPLGR